MIFYETISISYLENEKLFYNIVVISCGKSEIEEYFYEFGSVEKLINVIEKIPDRTY